MIRQSPVSVEELARDGQGDRAAGDRQDPRRTKIVALVETGEIPSATKLKAKFPRVADRGDQDPGRGREDRAPALRRARGHSASRTCARPPRASGSAASRASGRRSRRTCSPRSSSLGEEGPAERAAALGGAPGRRGAGRGAARAPGLRGGRGRRIGPAAGRDLQGHRPDRDRLRPGGARAVARRAPARRRSRARAGAAGTRDRRPTTGSRSTCGSSRPRPTGTCSSTSPARRSTTSSFASAP